MSKKAPEFLNTVFQKIRELDELNRLIKPILPKNAQDACEVANVQGDRVILLVANGSLATQLRLSTNEYLQAFKNSPQLKFIRELQFKVRMHLHQKTSRLQEKKSQPMALMSEKTAAMVDEMAESIHDPEVKAAMKRIAKRKKAMLPLKSDEHKK